jgi:hypothetical protein
MQRNVTIGLTIAVSASIFAGAAGFAPGQTGQQGGQPTNLDNHPPAGHPAIPKPADQWPKAKPEDVASVESIVAAYYASTSGKPKQARDWERFKSLFVPDARLIPARPTADGGAGAIYLPVSDYIDANRKYFESSGFIDRESAHRVEVFGNVAQVWSTYESRRQETDVEPYSRGIASIQLLKDGGRWWIVNVFWDFERPDNMIPAKYQHTPAVKE